MSFLARKKKLLMNSGPAPFSHSGSFENSTDGWVMTNGSSVAQFPRTGSYSARFGAAGHADLTYDASVAHGLDFNVSIYRRTAGVSATHALKYKIGSGSFVTLQTVTNSGTTYTQLSGAFSNPGNDSVTIRFDTSDQGWFDDWSVIAS